MNGLVPWRYGWEFLIELHAADNIDGDQKDQIALILRHFPSLVEIKTRALDGVTQNGFGGPKLLPENEPASQELASTLDYSGNSSCTSPSQRAGALRMAGQFFAALERSDNLYEEQLRRIPFILRHFPSKHEIKQWAQMEAWEAKRNTSFKAWLGPEGGLEI